MRLYSWRILIALGVISLLLLITAGPAAAYTSSGASESPALPVSDLSPNGTNLANQTNSDGVTIHHPLMHFTPEQLAEMQRQFDASPKYSAASPQNKFNSVVSLPVSKNLLSDITYIPSERDQGNCGDCWVWAATGALEVDHTVSTGINNRLSIQYFNSKFNNGAGSNWACCGGNLQLFSDWYNFDKTVLPWSNTNASFGDKSSACNNYQTHVPVGLISTTPKYNLTSLSYQTISTFRSGQATAINNIKSSLNANKAVVYSFFYGDAGWSNFFTFWDMANETTIFNPDPYAGENISSGHAVLIVGYDDSVPGSEYWLVLNSWGSTPNRPNDLFRLKMYMNYDAAYNSNMQEQHYFQILNSGFSTVSVPVANFTTNTSAGTTPLVVSFNDTSTGSTPTMWNWSFGDGLWFNTTLSSARNTTHVYTSAGTYTAEVTVSNTGGSSTSAGTTITVAPPQGLAASFTTNTSSGTAPLPVFFTDTSTGSTPTKWNWSFGDGSWSNTTSASQRNVTHVYAISGTYTARIIVSNTVNSSTSAGRTVTVTHLPEINASFSTNTSSGTTPLPVFFTDTSTGDAPTMWNWSFGDGSWFNTTNSSQRNVTHIYVSLLADPSPYATAGTYTAYLVVSDAVNSSTSSGKTIVVTSPPLLTASFITNVSSGTLPLAVQFTDTSTGTPTMWNWSFGDGSWSNTSVASARNVTHIFTTAGTLIAYLAVSNPGSSSISDGRTINITTSPVLAVSFSTNISSGMVPLAVLFTDLSTGGTPTVWNWSFGDGSWFNTTFASERNVTHLYTTAGIYPVTLTASNASSISTSPGRTITVTTSGLTNNTGVFRNSSGNWYLDATLTGAVTRTFHFGTTGDIPVTGDWDGNGVLDVGVFRPSNGNWYFDTTMTGVVNKTFHFGATGDIPVTGDWDGNRVQDVGVFRPSNGNWYFDTTMTGVVNKTFHFGATGDIPVTGDWDGNRVQDVGVFRPSNGNWYFDTMMTGVVNKTFHFGTTGDTPAIGKWI